MAGLKGRAFAALDEIAERTRKGPVERTLALRFTLAFLANVAEERWPFDQFWRAIVPDRLRSPSGLSSAWTDARGRMSLLVSCDSGSTGLSVTRRRGINSLVM